jgi:hypothetical protein
MPQSHLPITHVVGSKVDQTQTDVECLIHPHHHLFIQMGDFICKPLFIYSSDLFQQNHRIPVKPIIPGVDFHMGGEFRLLDLGSNRGDNHSGAKPVPNVILYHQNRSNPTLFRSDHWREIGKIDIATFDNQKNYTPLTRRMVVPSASSSASKDSDAIFRLILAISM